MSLRLRIEKVIAEISLPPALPRLASCICVFLYLSIYGQGNTCTSFLFFHCWFLYLCICGEVIACISCPDAPPPLPPSLPGLASASAGFCLTERSSRPRDPPLVEDGIAPPVTEDLGKEEGCGSDDTGIGNDTGLVLSTIVPASSGTGYTVATSLEKVKI